MNKIKTPRLLILILIILTVIIGLTTIGIAIFLQNSSSTASQSASASGPDLRSASCSPYIKAPITSCSQKDNADYKNFIVAYTDTQNKPSLSLATMNLSIVDKDTGQVIQGGYSVKGSNNYKVGQCINAQGQQAYCYGNACSLTGDAHNSSGPLPLGSETAGLDCLNSDFKITFDSTNPSTNQLARDYDINSISNCKVTTASGADGASISGTGTNIKANLCVDIHNQPKVTIVCQAAKTQSITPTNTITTTPTTPITPTTTVTPTTPVTLTPTPSQTTLTNTPPPSPTPTPGILTATPVIITPTVSPTLVIVQVTPVVTPTPVLPKTGIVDDFAKLTLTGIGLIGLSFTIYKFKFFNHIQNIFNSNSSSFERKIEKRLKKKK